jgi:Cu2+-exporting ATPase
MTAVSNAEKSQTTVDLPCVHCGEATRCVAGQDLATVFCCHGCQGAYELIHGWGLDNYYNLRDRSASLSRQNADQSRYSVFDSESFLGPSQPQSTADGLLTTELAVHGLHCAACAWLIESAAARTPGFRRARVKMSDHSIRIHFDPARIKLSQIAHLLGRLGYELAPLPEQRDDHFRAENRRLLVQIAIAGFCAANAMWIAVALYAGDLSGVEASHRDFLRVFGTALGTAAVVFPGRTFFRGAWASLRMRSPHMDLPVALGLAVGTIAGIYNAIEQTGDVYFDSLAVLVFLLLIGRWVQFRQQHRASQAVDLLLRITPRHANQVNAGGSTAFVLVDCLQPGDTIRVASGESIATDGTVIVGESMIDRSLLTGESRPLAVQPGDEVFAGTLNLQLPIDVRVAAVGRESRMGRVMQAVEEASSEKTPIVQLADRIGGVFVVVVTLLAGVVLWAWSGSGWTVAASHATALLIVACPCALALATPLAIAVSLGRAAKQKILIRDGGSLQHLGRPGVIWFDKTGTLTAGRMRAEWVAGSPTAIAAAAAIEQQSTHPIAVAIVQAAERDQLPRSAQATLDEVFPGGVAGTVDGRRVEVGNIDFMQSRNIYVDESFAAAAEKCLQNHSSPILISVDGEAAAVLAICDPLKEGARQAIAELTRRGWQVGILSGDHPEIVRHVAAQVGVDADRALGGLSPEQKLSIVRERDSAAVVMVGDGANDAAALAAADVGIAVRGGAEVSLQAAPIYVASGSIAAIVDLVRGARSTAWLIATAFLVSLSYNAVAVGLAMAGLITPLAAAVLMPISSISVLTLTLVWPTFRPQTTSVS